MTFEQTLHAPYMVKIPGEVRDGDLFPYWWQTGTRIEFYGTKGLMLLGRHGGGWQVFVRTKNREPVVVDQMFGRFPDREHHQNFLDCVRSRKRPNADIEEGHISAFVAIWRTSVSGREIDNLKLTHKVSESPTARMQISSCDQSIGNRSSSRMQFEM